MGVEGTLWTEWIGDREKLEFNSNPRFAALGETGWSMPENKDITSFRARLETLKPVYAKCGIRYACDKVAFAKSPIRRLKEMKIWNGNNKYHELQEDVKLRAKAKK